MNISILAFLQDRLTVFHAEYYSITSRGPPRHAPKPQCTTVYNTRIPQLLAFPFSSSVVLWFHKKGVAIIFTIVPM